MCKGLERAARCSCIPRAVNLYDFDEMILFFKSLVCRADASRQLFSNPLFHLFSFSRVWRVMTLRVGLLQALLLCGICGSLAEDSNLFFEDDAGGGTEVAWDTDLAASPALGDLASVLLPPGVLSASLPSSEDESTSNLFDINDKFGLEPLANSGVDCGFDQGQQSIGAIGRRGKVCPDVTPYKDPRTDTQQPPKTPDKLFPPPGSNPGRVPGISNDPRPRPDYAYPAANSDFDFQFCPAGVNGYRQYAICDSGFEDDRLSDFLGYYSLWYVTRRKYTHITTTKNTVFDRELTLTNQPMSAVESTVFSCFPPHKRWCCEHYDPNQPRPNTGFANFCREMLINEFYWP